MKLRSSLIVPVLAASILAPAAGSAVMNHFNTSNKSVTQETAKHHHKSNHEKDLTNIINQYASSDLKNKLTQDLATHKNLEGQLHKTAGFQKQKAQEKAQRQAFYEAHKQEIDAIQQQVKDGKLTKQQAHKQLEAVFGKHEGKDRDHDKGKEQGKRNIQQELKAAVQKKGKAAIQAALEKFDQQLQHSNQKLQQEINANQ
ncbi:hypothetical protein [Bacillus cereus group sp. BfR-BA-01380]|uniref:hypothetical protein n=1 Tax=Bacillus cereus group sp. BfR-BA-01380 TaxID=2920324 RepID=UPI001F576089|nr:hypothetical protein [Bacillus cereus group sp. BfR-BA-01380]